MESGVAKTGVHGKYTLLFADVSVLAADSVKKLTRLVPTFWKVCKRRKLNTNVGKGMIMNTTSEGTNGEEVEVRNRFSIRVRMMERLNYLRRSIYLFISC